MHSKIKMWQLALLMLTITPITKFILLPATLSIYLERDSYVLIFIYIIVDILALLCILYCYKKSPESSFYQILESSLGKFIAKTIMVLYFSFFFLKTIAPLIEQNRMLAGNLYESIPRVSTLIPMFILAGYIAYKGAYAIGRNANIMGFVSVISILCILLLSIGNANFDNLLPFFDRSPSSLLISAQRTVMWFGDFTILLFMLGKITQRKKGTSIKSLVICYVLAQVLILAFYLILIAIFGEITERQANAISKISKYNTSLTNLGRFDWLPIILLMLCLMMTTVTTYYCSSECILPLAKNPRRLPIIVVLTIAYCLAALLLQDDLHFLYTFLSEYYLCITILLQYIIPFTLPILLSIGRKKHAKTLQHQKSII